MTKNKIVSLVLAAAVAGSVCLGGGATPALAAKKTTQLYASGKGTRTNPWHIRTAKQFSNIRKHLNGNFILDKNISLSSYKDFDPIGSFTGDKKDDEQASTKTAFTGTFDGNGKTISNVSITANGEKGVGLFGAVSGKGVIRDLTVKNATVENGGFYVTQYKEYYPTPASISVDHCYADADITNGRIIGVIAGYISEDSSIDKCGGSVRFQGKDVSELTGGTPATISVDTLG